VSPEWVRSRHGPPDRLAHRAKGDFARGWERHAMCGMVVLGAEEAPATTKRCKSCARLERKVGAQ